MKAIHANPFLSSFANVLKMVAMVEVEKGDTGKTVGLDNDHSYTFYFEVIEGLKGFYGVSFSEEVAFFLVEKMTGTKPTELDEMGLSAIQEIIEMTKGNAITELSQQGIQCKLGDTQKLETENPFTCDSMSLVMTSPIGSFVNQFYIEE